MKPRLALFHLLGLTLLLGWNRAWWDYEVKGTGITHIFALEWWAGPTFSGVHFFAGPFAFGAVR